MKMMTPIDGMKDNTGNVFIRISDDKNQIYDYRYILRQAGFEFNKRSGDKSFYEKKTDEKMAGNGNYTAKGKTSL